MADRKTPRDILIERGQLDKDVIAVNAAGRIVDLLTPIDASTTIEPIRAKDPLGLKVIRHSTAHVMADAVQRLFPGTKVTIGPAIEDGFYYDFDKAGGGTFSEDDLAKIEKTMIEIIKRDTPFRREVVTRDAALEQFTKMGETFKLEIIRAIPQDEEVSLYKHGATGEEWVDVCEGPHVPRTGFLKAVKLTSVAGAYWRGDERNPMLQRIYGTAFSSKEALEEHLKLIEEAKARDHRKLGKELDLIMFNEIAPAMPFFLPKGAYVYNRLVEYVRTLYVQYGYEEVITPLAYDPKLFRQSGHLGHYNENMYRLWTEDLVEAQRSGPRKGELEGQPLEQESPGAALLKKLQEDSFALKPMNCPSHCVIFGSKKRSYRDLPWRVADFARLHRYERGGVVHGLARVRSFSQDDAHIFCAEGDVPSEIERFIKMIYAAYKVFDFKEIDIKLATRPPADQRLGNDADWDASEGALSAGLKAADLPFEIAPGEGAFYGPKVEFHVKDALKRSWQLGTIQFDKNLPNRFELSFVGEDGKDHMPIMLHRAVLGSLERFFAVYLEHVGGNFPTWLSPKQAIVLTVSDKSDEFAKAVHKRMLDAGIRADVDTSADKLGAKIRNARLQRYPFLCVVGPKEAESDSLGVRSRERGELGAIKVDELIAMVKKESAPE